MVEHQVAAVLGRLDHAGVAGGAEREPVGTVDSGLEEYFHGLGHVPGIGVEVVAQLNRRMRRSLRDPGDPGGVEAVTHRAVLRTSDPLRGLVEAREVGVCCAPVGVAQLRARHAEGGAQLDERQHAPLVRPDAVGRTVDELADPSEIRAGMLPAVGAGEVHELPGGQRGSQSLGGLVVEHLPARVGYRCD
jgi:hypothetical protein